MWQGRRETKSAQSHGSQGEMVYIGRESLLMNADKKPSEVRTGESTWIYRYEGHL